MLELEKKFHYELKLNYGWILESKIFPTSSLTSYRTYKIRFLLITSENNKKFNKPGNFKTFINNWIEHLLILRNIYQLKLGQFRNYPTVSDQFTNFGALDSKLKYYDEMKIFLKQNKLLDY